MTKDSNTIRLDGYFDKNFGDDMMHIAVLRALPEIRFSAPSVPEEMTAHLAEEPNFVKSGGADFRAAVRVIGTGFMYNGAVSRMYKFAEMFREREKTETAVINCSVEPVKGMASSFFTKRELRKCALITCRDKVSNVYIRNAVNTEKTKVECFPDMVFSFSDEIRGMRSDMGYLGIAPVRRQTAGNHYEYYKKLAEAADRFIENIGKRVILFAFDNGQENDVSACGSIRIMMEHKDMADIAVYNSNPREFVGQIAECGRFITSRFHGAVAAAAAGIPIYAISDRRKLDVLCAELDQPCERRYDKYGGELDWFVTGGTPCAAELPQDTAELAKKHSETLGKWLETIS